MRGSPGSGFTAVYRREGRLFQYDALKDGAPGETRLPGVWLCIRLLLVLGRVCLVVCGVVRTGFYDRYPSCWQSCQERCVMASVCFLMPFLAVYFLVFVLLSVPPKLWCVYLWHPLFMRLFVFFNKLITFFLLRMKNHRLENIPLTPDFSENHNMVFTTVKFLKSWN